MVRRILSLLQESAGVGLCCLSMLLGFATMMDMVTNLSGGVLDKNAGYVMVGMVMSAVTGVWLLATAD